jgi:hypothetical protein
MISNIPTFTQHQDFQAWHADMLAAARQLPWRPSPVHLDPRWDDPSLTVQQRVDAFLTDR